MTKAEARALAYRRLREQGAARFPFPIEGRIPSFRGAETAAERLRSLPVYRDAAALKVNPDAPQQAVCVMALRDGKTLYLATPRLRGGFRRIRPEEVPAGEERAAARLTTRDAYGALVPVDSVRVDLVVVGSVAVAPDGTRAGKGEGYADIEYALLRELGHPDVPVATTVHPAQVVPALPHDAHDMSVDWIATPEGVLQTRTPHPKPAGIDWSLLAERDVDLMPVLAELRRARWEHQTVADILVPGLAVVFVGINPGRASAGAGHHFAGPGSHFWRLLHEAGFTPWRWAPEEDVHLPELGIGVTNVVARASRGEQDLSWPELVAGGEALRARIAACRPSLVTLLGKQVYRAYAGLPKSAEVPWGLQPRQTVPGVREVAAANPSPRSTVPYAQRLAQFAEIRRLTRP